MKLLAVLIFTSLMPWQAAMAQDSYRERPTPSSQIPRGPQERPQEVPARTSSAQFMSEQERLERRQEMLDKQTKQWERTRKTQLQKEYELMPDGRAWE